MPDYAALAGFDDDALFALIGAEQLGPADAPALLVLERAAPELAEELQAAGAFPRLRLPSRDQLIEAGKERYRQLVEQFADRLRELVCPSWRELDGKARVELAETLAPVVVEEMLGGSGAGEAAAVAVVLCRSGLDALCADAAA